MKVLNYVDAIRLAKELSNDLVKDNKLMNHCRVHNLNYHNVITFIRGTRKAKQPKLISDFLKSLGYYVTVDKQIIYKFIIDTTENDGLNIDELLQK
ncbi:hypothetical protein LNQ49_06165 [Flavobacterium sp. F-65]|uniref:Uncharacterized protein n=1 Tax=Flavobacterium pisciphilum TaxID=2893755 RepID=A0ABS8MST4_9FLAO|nr:hypothetical protein [Flavobacterium sp. F-65]MCC9071177.1 hypothetical protein [Flavobacterium sp. F-65]